MRHDLEILRELFLPLLDDIAAHAPGLTSKLERDPAFWERLSLTLLHGGEHLKELLGSFGAQNVEELYAQCQQLAGEYLYYLAQNYCAGETNPTIDRLILTGDTRFATEVSFQRDMIAAVRHVGRAELKKELAQEAAFAGEDVTREEISAAFNAMQQNIAIADLRNKLQQWDEEEETVQQAETPKRKRRLTVPLLFLRVAAAAAVFTGGVVGVVAVYNNNRNNAPATSYEQAVNAGSAPEAAAHADTVAAAPSAAQNTTPVPSSSATTTAHGKVLHHDSTANTVHLPQIVVRGKITDVNTGDTVTNVLVTMEDDKGNKQTVLSKDGTFSFDLSLQRDYTITGKKDRYRSARLSFSTKDVKETDADDEIKLTLRLTAE